MSGPAFGGMAIGTVVRTVVLLPGVGITCSLAAYVTQQVAPDWSEFVAAMIVVLPAAFGTELWAWVRGTSDASSE